MTTSPYKRKDISTVIADEHLTEFQELYRKHFGEDISKEKALEKGLRLIRLMEVILKYHA